MNIRSLKSVGLTSAIFIAGVVGLVLLVPWLMTLPIGVQLVVAILFILSILTGILISEIKALRAERNEARQHQVD